MGGRRSSHPSLLVGLSLSLDFENSANLGRDGTGRNHLANNGTVVPAAGKVGRSSAFFHGAPQSLAHTNTASLRIDAGDLTLGFWLNPIDPSPNGYNVVGKWTDGSPEYLFSFNRFNSKWDWRVGGNVNVVSPTTATLPFGVWSWVELTWIAATGTAGVTVNNGTPETFVGGAATITDANSFLLGGTNGGVLGGDFAGTFDNFNLWQRQLTGSERTFLASGIPGSEYPF